MKDFDKAAERFTFACHVAANWKQNYLGAAYSTRLETACSILEDEIAAMRAAIKADDEAIAKWLIET